MALVVFNPRYSAQQEQERLHQLMPASHEYGDKKATLPDGRVIAGRREHDAWVPAGVRIRCRKRCTVMPIVATHTGIGHSRAALSAPVGVISCFVPVPDWHASGLDAEALFLKPLASALMPRIGSYAFDFQAYVANVYEDVSMALTTMRQFAANGARFHLKVVPIGVGTGIRTRYGEPLAPMILPAYLLAMQYAIAALVDETWVDTLEFIDHSHGSLTPYVQNSRRLRVMSASTRDVFDFSGATGIPAVLAPTDAFCRIGGSVGDKNLGATMANNSNIRQMLSTGGVQFMPWGTTAVPPQETPVHAAAQQGDDSAVQSASDPTGPAQTTQSGPTQTAQSGSQEAPTENHRRPFRDSSSPGRTNRPTPGRPSRHQQSSAALIESWGDA
jgi:hypothetical protein